MIEEAGRKLKAKIAKRGKEAEYLEKLAFVKGDATSLGELIRDGLAMEPLLNVTSLQTREFNNSLKVFCCLCNTLGNVWPEYRGDFVTQLAMAMGDEDTVAISVFGAERFRDEAPGMYLTLVPITGSFNPSAFSARCEFTTSRGYYSHWFDWTELVELLQAPGTRLVTPNNEEQCKINGAYFVVCGKQCVSQ